MNNKIVGIIVDAGHGGMDSGAVGNGLFEKDLNLQAALYIYKRLQELGIPAKLTRDDDSYLPKDERIKKVKELYNNSPNTILISNHINAGGAEGAEVVYSLKNNDTLANLILNKIGEKGQIKRKVYQRRLPENPNKDYYYILRETGNTEPVLIEYGFIDNINDSKKLKDSILDYAEGVVEAIAIYTGNNYMPNQKENTYIVKEGDTLYSIGRRFNTSVEKLKEINNLINNNIYKGQVLYIDDKDNSTDTNIYQVQKGDTLYKIASLFNTTVDEIKKINNLTTNELYIGDKLIIPENEEIKDEYDIYTVQKGDSLWKIANNYNISTKDLIELNNLDNLVLQINQKLLVPKVVDKNIYIVEKGDTIWSIAKKNNLTVEKLKELNNLDSNLLSVGQEIIIKEKNL